MWENFTGITILENTLTKCSTVEDEPVILPVSALLGLIHGGSPTVPTIVHIGAQCIELTGEKEGGVRTKPGRRQMSLHVAFSWFQP